MVFWQLQIFLLWAILYKELKISTFDASVALGVGLMPMLIHYLLMIMVATTAVVAFESVGAILVIAFFIVPASAAYLLTDRLSKNVVLSVSLGIISAVTGYLFAICLMCQYLVQWLQLLELFLD